MGDHEAAPSWQRFTLPDWIRRALRAAMWTFLGAFGLSLLGWLGDVAQWANCEADCNGFPLLTPLGKAAVAAAVAASTLFIAAIVNYAEDHSRRMPAILKAPASGGWNPTPQDDSRDLDA